MRMQAKNSPIGLNNAGTIVSVLTYGNELIDIIGQSLAREELIPPYYFIL